MFKKPRLMKKSFLILLLYIIPIKAQKIHIHNDYQQNIPFWTAIAAKADQIEVDIYLKNNKLYVAHEEETIKKNRTLQNVYLSAIKKAILLDLLEDKPLRILVDIKSEPYSTLKKLEQELSFFFKENNYKNIVFIISGRRPKPKDYKNYSKYILFDWQEKQLPINKKIHSKIGLISYNFKNYSTWNGKGKIVSKENDNLKRVIQNAHSIGKPIRFWASPDSKSAWKTFTDLQIDYINTDAPQKCANYLKSLPKKWFKNTVFSKVYKPTFKTDKKELPIKNIILMIGDGNGLTQISAAALANKGDLTLMQFKSSGLIKTQSADDFTTDSAAAGSAIATGKKTYNRAIGVDVSGNKTENITEYLSKHNFNTAIITTDEIFGATPSAFYAHQKDRGLENKIAKELLTSKLTLFAGGGEKKYDKDSFKKHQFKIVKTINKINDSTSQKIGYFFSKGRVPSVLEGRNNALAEVTKASLAFLKVKNKPFFMMVEAAQIDSYGHHNNVGGVITETIDFDRAITEAVKFADQDKQTLVIVLADHETAGFSIPQGNTKTNHIEGAFFSNDHTGVMVPIFAYGPKSNEFEGCYENSKVYHKILKVLKLNK